MFFQFNSYFDEFTPDAWRPFAEHLTNLLEAHRAGRHVYFGSRRHLRTLAACDFLGHVPLRTVNEIAARHVDFLALRRSLPRIVEICDFTQHAPTGDANIVSIAVGALLQRATLEECHILV